MLAENLLPLASIRGYVVEIARNKDRGGLVDLSESPVLDVRKAAAEVVVTYERGNKYKRNL